MSHVMRSKTTYQIKPSNSAKVKSNLKWSTRHTVHVFRIFFDSTRVFQKHSTNCGIPLTNAKMWHTRTAYVNSFPDWTNPLHSHCQGWHLVCWFLLISDGTSLGFNDHAKPHYLRLYLFYCTFLLNAFISGTHLFVIRARSGVWFFSENVIKNAVNVSINL